ncbi:DUF4489 domain-containing protein [Clostridium uliginosum]|uniref:DUF4489 domain-containing protein n=1 Tax=Clostridium uliginosum TaxID=119641 RepID=A0A1I1K2Y9_9CLOT|nr:DUF4489 domain-containing protein [Clostridium uliginosum]SFC51980.1 protein of unknown function [Clostridium uliginosum]
MNIISENEKSLENYMDHEEHCHSCEPKHCHSCEPKHCHSCEPKHCHSCVVCETRHSCACEPGRALLRCSCGLAGPLPILGTAGLIPTTPISVGSVSIDTTRMCNPSVLISATFQINTPIAILSNLTFRVVKCVNGCTQPVGGSFTFSNAVEALSSESFSFKFCDSTECCGCATYSVEISSATLLQAGTTVSGTITALAVENLC